MRKLRKILTLLFTVAAGPLLAADETRQIGDRSFERDGGAWTQIDPDGLRYDVDPSIITVRFKQEVEPAARRALHPTLGAEEMRTSITGFVDVEIAFGQDVFAAIDAYLASGLVELAEPNTIGRYEIDPNDPSYGSQWFLPAIDAPDAWETTTGDPSIIIAVLDSGTEFTHEDLGTGTDGYENIWLNSGEDAWSDPSNPSTGNGVDDDSNGYTDDWKGWDFGNGNNDPSGPFFHGTSVGRRGRRQNPQREGCRQRGRWLELPRRPGNDRRRR